MGHPAVGVRGFPGLEGATWGTQLDSTVIPLLRRITVLFTAKPLRAIPTYAYLVDWAPYVTWTSHSAIQRTQSDRKSSEIVGNPCKIFVTKNGSIAGNSEGALLCIVCLIR